MQYIRRRILRVSGVTVRDERLERQDFAASAPVREEWDDFLARKNDDAATRRRTPMVDWDNAGGERT